MFPAKPLATLCLEVIDQLLLIGIVPGVQGQCLSPRYTGWWTRCILFWITKGRPERWKTYKCHLITLLCIIIIKHLNKRGPRLKMQPFYCTIEEQNKEEEKKIKTLPASVPGITQYCLADDYLRIGMEAAKFFQLDSRRWFKWTKVDGTNQYANGYEVNRQKGCWGVKTLETFKWFTRPQTAKSIWLSPEWALTNAKEVAFSKLYQYRPGPCGNYANATSLKWFKMQRSPLNKGSTDLPTRVVQSKTVMGVICMRQAF